MKTETFVLQPQRHYLWIGIGLVGLAIASTVASFLLPRGSLQVVAFVGTVVLLLGGVYCFIRAERRDSFTCSWNERQLEILEGTQVVYTGKWDNIAGLREDEEDFILLRKDDPEPVVLPKRAMRQGLLVAFRERINPS